MNPVENLPPVQSALQIDPVVFDELSFHREGFENQNSNIQTELAIAKNVSKISDGKYRVTLSVEATRKDEYVAKVQISGFCSIEETLKNKNVLLNSNAVAILFAYVRSELTLLTAQPGTAPIVLPVVNVVKMIENAEKTDQS